MSRWTSPSSSWAYCSAAATWSPTSTTALGGSGRYAESAPPVQSSMAANHWPSSSPTS